MTQKEIIARIEQIKIGPINRLIKSLYHNDKNWSGDQLTEIKNRLNCLVQDITKHGDSQQE